jgi:hypothetical protein
LTYSAERGFVFGEKRKREEEVEKRETLCRRRSSWTNDDDDDDDRKPSQSYFLPLSFSPTTISARFFIHVFHWHTLSTLTDGLLLEIGVHGARKKSGGGRTTWGCLKKER